MKKKTAKAKKASTIKKKAATKSVSAKVGSSNLFQDIEKRMMDMEKRFESIFSGKLLPFSKWEMPEWPAMPSLEMKTPKVDIIDRDKDILVRADIPGVKKENLDVSLTDNTITIKGSTSEEKKEEEGDYFRSETIKGSFSRTMSLPGEIDGSKAKSTFKDGVLEITVPKLAKAKKHSVKIK